MTFIASANVIDRDLTCDGCEYNLRGLPGNGRCPECALPIERSIAAQALGAVSLRQLKLTRAAQLLFVLEFFSAATAGVIAFKLRWWGLPGVLIPVALTWVAWACAIAGFILIAWMHRERQSIALRWPWFARSVGLIVCGMSIASTATRMWFSSTPLPLLVLLGFLAIGVTPIPSLSWYTISKRLRKGRLLARMNIACAVALSLIATWCALHIARDIPSAPQWTAFTAMPIAGVDYTTLLVPMLSRPWRTPFLPIGVVMITMRAVWIVLTLVMQRQITSEIRERQAGDVERTSASSRP